MEESPYSAPRADAPFATRESDAVVDPAQDPVAFVRDLHRRHYGDWTIVKKAAEYGIAAEEVEAILAHLRAAELAEVRRYGWYRLLFGSASFLLGFGGTISSIVRGEYVTFYWGAIIVGGLIAVQGVMFLRTPPEPQD